MIVEFITNLGSREAIAMGLDFKECAQSALLEVDSKTGDSLVARQRAVVREIRAVAIEPEIKAVPVETPVAIETPPPAAPVESAPVELPKQEEPKTEAPADVATVSETKFSKKGK